MASMNYFLIILLILLVLVALILLLALIMIKRKKEGLDQSPDYRAFFIMGVIFAPSGLIMMALFAAFIGEQFIVLGIPLLGIGLSYIAIGLSNRDKWKEKKKPE